MHGGTLGGERIGAMQGDIERNRRELAVRGWGELDGKAAAVGICILSRHSFILIARRAHSRGCPTATADSDLASSRLPPPACDRHPGLCTSRVSAALLRSAGPSSAWIAQRGV